jgi:hypothetical protein
MFSNIREHHTFRWHVNPLSVCQIAIQDIFASGTDHSKSLSRKENFDKTSCEEDFNKLLQILDDGQ